MEQLTFKLDVIEGPLDLILQLIQKHKLNIHDIEITCLLSQYMQHIATLKKQNLELATAFIEMASQLVYIKTISLLPKYEEEEIQLKQDLSGRLLEYQACKEAAQRLKAQNRGNDIFVRKGVVLETDLTYTVLHPIEMLLNAYIDAIGKGMRKLPPPVHCFSEIIATPIVSVESRMVIILRCLYKTPTMAFSQLFLQSTDKSEVIATFLAILELVKSNRIGMNESCEQISLISK
ncbi:MAG: segregation/condensation protein A [Oscillospiraceae bacterium]